MGTFAPWIPTCETDAPDPRSRLLPFDFAAEALSQAERSIARHRSSGFAPETADPRKWDPTLIQPTETPDTGGASASMDHAAPARWT